MNRPPYRVLVADDEADFLETLMRRLEKRQVEAMGVSGGREALEKLSQRPVDVVILDVRMPGMDGLEVLQEIEKSWPLVEVILLTGHASVESGLQGMELGAFDYAMKPCKLLEMLPKIELAYERKRLGEKAVQ
ncbi:response regulator [Desulfosoma caldarium]|uniref:Response regulator receiver domain-containing protein n=1 Tax=Desulfosoma caldarium TaxID=610254 RepID=A0A3N1VLM0_9BACT|nr:response regulator [Desulfosoma caldarium]ROR02939.1 response regulator receiver domain-containing protein [Desulfosoma caldarium]